MRTMSKSRTTTRKRAFRREAGRTKGLVGRRLPRYRPPTHPGEMLVEEFLRPLGITQSAMAVRLGISFPRLNEIVRGKRGVTPDTALRLVSAVMQYSLPVVTENSLPPRLRKEEGRWKN